MSSYIPSILRKSPPSYEKTRNVISEEFARCESARVQGSDFVTSLAKVVSTKKFANLSVLNEIGDQHTYALDTLLSVVNRAVHTADPVTGVLKALKNDLRNKIIACFYDCSSCTVEQVDLVGRLKARNSNIPAGSDIDAVIAEVDPDKADYPTVMIHPLFGAPNETSMPIPDRISLNQLNALASLMLRSSPQSAFPFVETYVALHSVVNMVQKRVCKNPASIAAYRLVPKDQKAAFIAARPVYVSDLYATLKKEGTFPESHPIWTQEFVLEWKQQFEAAEKSEADYLARLATYKAAVDAAAVANKKLAKEKKKAAAIAAAIAATASPTEDGSSPVAPPTAEETAEPVVAPLIEPQRDFTDHSATTTWAGVYRELLILLPEVPRPEAASASVSRNTHPSAMAGRRMGGGGGAGDNPLDEEPIGLEPLDVNASPDEDSDGFIVENMPTPAIQSPPASTAVVTAKRPSASPSSGSQDTYVPVKSPPKGPVIRGAFEPQVAHRPQKVSAAFSDRKSRLVSMSNEPHELTASGRSAQAELAVLQDLVRSLLTHMPDITASFDPETRARIQSYLSSFGHNLSMARELMDYVSKVLNQTTDSLVHPASNPSSSSSSSDTPLQQQRPVYTITDPRTNPASAASGGAANRTMNRNGVMSDCVGTPSRILSRDQLREARSLPPRA